MFGPPILIDMNEAAIYEWRLEETVCFRTDFRDSIGVEIDCGIWNKLLDCSSAISYLLYPVKVVLSEALRQGFNIHNR